MMKISETFKIQLSSLNSILLKKHNDFVDNNELKKELKNSYFISLISMVYTYFEKFIKDLVEEKNKILNKTLPNNMEKINNLTKKMYFSSKKENIKKILDIKKTYNDKHEWEKLQALNLELREILFPTNLIENINPLPFRFSQNLGELLEIFNNEFGDRVLGEIKLKDFINEQKPANIRIDEEAIIDGKTFYSKYLSNPRSKAVHEAQIEDNFNSEIIEKNKVDEWLNTTIIFVEKIEDFIIGLCLN